jgi:hypothetical protein
MMTIHDWIEEQRRLLTRFEQWWEENHRVSSVQFPLFAEPGGLGRAVRLLLQTANAGLLMCIPCDFGRPRYEGRHARITS